MWNKVRKVICEISEATELLMAVVVIIGIFVAVIALVPEGMHYWQTRMQPGAFVHFLDAVLEVVVGIEFVKMLCKPSAEHVIEVLIFLISRHMIIQTTTAWEDLLSVVSIGILFFFQKFMEDSKEKKKRAAEKMEKPEGTHKSC